MLQTLQIISLVVGIPSTAIVLLTSVCKPFRAWLFGRYRGQETDRCLLRDRITEIYYKHYQERRMQYKKLKGNSFVDKIWNEVQTWTIDE